MKTIEGNLDASKLKIGIAVSRFNDLIGKQLLSSAVDCLKRHGTKDENIAVCWTPGALELGYVAKKLCEDSKYDVVICLGAVIRGETPHFEYVASQSAKMISQISLSSPVPVIFGVLTTDTLEQALNRAGAKIQNKGFQAALTAIEMANLKSQI
jgi:6,7-dimethyl-8-ribityllumazine synthase